MFPSLLTQDLMDEGDGNRSFAHGRCHAFDFTAPDITDGEDARATRLEKMRRPGQRPAGSGQIALRQIRAGLDEAFLVQHDARFEPSSVRHRSGHQKDVPNASAANGNYGLLWWLRPRHAFAAVGIYGQAIYVNPPWRLVIVTHSTWPRATD